MGYSPESPGLVLGGKWRPGANRLGSTQFQYQKYLRPNTQKTAAELAYEARKKAELGGYSGTGLNYNTKTATEPSGGYTGGFTGQKITEDDLNQIPPGDYYNRMYAEYERQQQEAMDMIESARDEALAARKAAYDTGVGSLNKTSDEALRQAYISKQMTLRDLPQQLATIGTNGGAAESTLVGVDADYGENRRAIENQKQQALAQLASDYQSGAASDASQWTSQIASMIQQQAQSKLAYAQWAAEQAQARMAQQKTMQKANNYAPQKQSSEVDIDKIEPEENYAERKKYQDQISQFLYANPSVTRGSDVYNSSILGMLSGAAQKNGSLGTGGLTAAQIAWLRNYYGV